MAVRRQGIVGLIFLAFVLGAVGTTAHHEMWRDELQAWMLARDSVGLVDFARNARFEGHPPLWHLCLFLLSKVSGHPIVMQAFHLVVAAGSALLVLRHAPLPMWQRTLFVFGYIPFYEFCVKSRGYALGVCLALVFCVLFQRWRLAATAKSRQRPGAAACPSGMGHGRILLLGLVLGLLCLTSVIGAIIAVGFALVTVSELHRRSSWRRLLVCPGLLGGLAVFLAALGVAVLWVIPPGDGGYARETVLHFDANRYASVVSRLSHSFFPLPGAVLQPIRTSWDHPAAYAFFVWGLSFFWRRREVVLFYVFTTFALLILLYTKYFGLFWHHAHFFLFWFLGLWLARTEAPKQQVEETALVGRVRDVSIAVVLTVHVFTGVAAHVRDWKHPFSAGRVTAEFVSGYRILGPPNRQSSGAEPRAGQRWLLAGDLDFVVSSVMGYLPKGSSILYVAGERYGTFIRWDVDRLERVQPGWEAVAFAAEEGYRLGADVLFVASYELQGGFPDGVREVFRAEESIWPDERYFVYEVELPK